MDLLSPKQERPFHPDTDSKEEHLFPTSNPEGYQLPADWVLPVSGPDPKSAVVIGAGVIGITTAYELAKKGYHVTVIEKYSSPAAFCSHGNAGVIRNRAAPDHHRDENGAPPTHPHSRHSHQPFSAAETLKMCKTMLPWFKVSPTSYSFLDPRFFTEWQSYRFLKCKFTLFANKLFYKYLYFGAAKYEENLEKSLQIFYRYAHQSFKQNLSVFGDQLEVDQQHLKIFTDNKHNKSSSDTAHTLSDESVNHTTNNNTHDIQALKNQLLYNNNDGYKTEETVDAYCIDCKDFCKSVYKHSVQKYGVRYRFNCEATNIWVDNRNILGVTLNNRKLLSASVVCVCGGILTDNMLHHRMSFANTKPVRISIAHVPIMPLQGYSITVDIGDTENENENKNENGRGSEQRDAYEFPHSMHLYEPYKVYASHINRDTLRFSSYGYLRSMSYATKHWYENVNKRFNVDVGVSLNRKANHMNSGGGGRNSAPTTTEFEKDMWLNLETLIETKLNLLSVYNVSLKAWNRRIRWSGYRPFSVDGMPIVSQAHPNINGLYINAGHGRYGFGLSHMCAKYLAHLITDELNQNEQQFEKLLDLRRFKLGQSLLCKSSDFEYQYYDHRDSNGDGVSMVNGSEVQAAF